MKKLFLQRPVDLKLKVLIIKLSSLGDVIHTLPAVNDLKQLGKTCEVSWVVEEAFAEIVSANANVDRVIPIALRRWRKSWLASFGEIRQFLKEIRAEHYDLIIDPQGLMKSALVASACRLSNKGLRVGYDKASIKEPLASMFYDNKHPVARRQHAITRTRQLFAQAFGYSLDAGRRSDTPGVAVSATEIVNDRQLVDSATHYGFVQSQVGEVTNSIMFLHGTTWASKHWPDAYWCELAQHIVSLGYTILLPQSNEVELARATQIEAYVDQQGSYSKAQASDQASQTKNGVRSNSTVKILPLSSLTEIFEMMKQCAGFVSVDTGLGHLACALERPLIGLYGSTDPSLTGPTGSMHRVLTSQALPCIPCMKKHCQYDQTLTEAFPPCFQAVTPVRVRDRLSELLDANKMIDTKGDLH